MTRDNFWLFFWGVTIILLTVTINLCEHSFSHSFALAVALLPAIFALKYSLQNISFEDKFSGVRNLTFTAVASLALGWIMVGITYYNFGYFNTFEIETPLDNPFRLILLIVIPAITLWRIAIIMERRKPYDDKIVFVSERRNITLNPATILLIESNDTEVYIYTLKGESYRTHTRISHWESQLDSRFVRVHRSYIINRNHVRSFDSQRITIADRTIEISRKYKDIAKAKIPLQEG